MRVTRLLDVAVFAMVAVAVLMPRPDVTAKPGLELDAQARAKVAELQAQLMGQPGALEPSLELADLLLDGGRPEWAVAALTPAIARHPADHRLHARRSMALAETYDLQPAFDSVNTALTLCQEGSTHPCEAHESARLGLIRSALARVKDIDAREHPNQAKERLIRELRPTFLPRRRPPAAP